MSDFTNSKPALGAVYPINALDTSWNRLEPLITPEEVRTQHLFGIPLVSFFPDPVTGKRQVFTNEIIKEVIVRSVSIVETETNLDIFPIQRREKHDWDRALYMSFGYFQLLHKPCSSIEQISVSPPDNSDIFIVPPLWVETARLQYGNVNIIPLLVSLQTQGGVVQATTAGAAVFLSIFSNRNYVPSFWAINYTTGFPNGNLPRIFNELIGTVAAMEILGMLAATYRYQSVSLGIDGMSQSQSGPGPQLFAVRMQQLTDKRKMLTKKLRSMYGDNLFSSNV